VPAPRDIEVELKLETTPADLDRLAAAPLLAEAEISEKQQVSTYFDAPGLPLRAAGLSLRVRQRGDQFVQTVKAEGKAAAGLFARPEWERDVDGERPIVDDASGPLAMLLPTATLQAVAPIFAVHVTRRTAVVQHGDASIELVFDVGEVRAGDRTAPIAEIELELKGGSSEALFAFARELGALAPLRLGVLTKSERGYRLTEGGTKKSAPAEETVLAADATTAEAFERIAGGCLRQFCLNEAILAQTDSAAALHQARVGLRRLRSALSISRPVLEDAGFEHFRAELRWLAQTLGMARDIDVLLARGGAYDVEPLRAARSEAYAAVHAALDSERARALMIDLSEWIALGAWRTAPADPAMPERPAAMFAATTLDRLSKRLRKRSEDLASLSDEERHEVRILAKKLRYAAGFFATLFTDRKAARRARRFTAALAEMQEQLGTLNDLSHGAVVLAGLGLEDIAPPPSPKRRKALIAAAASAAETFADAKRFWR
jgi:triphosphatase